MGLRMRAVRPLLVLISFVSIVRYTDHSSQLLLSRNDTHTHHGDLLLTAYPTPDSSILIDLEASA